MRHKPLKLVVAGIVAGLVIGLAPEPPPAAAANPLCLTASSYTAIGGGANNSWLVTTPVAFVATVQYVYNTSAGWDYTQTGSTEIFPKIGGGGFNAEVRFRRNAAGNRTGAVQALYTC
jgi:hypothetical protein